MRFLRLIYYYFRRRTPQTFQPVVLVTGCTSGIGLALAELLRIQPEYRVVITGRAGSLAELRRRFPDTERFWVRSLDVTVAGEREALIKEIRRHWGGVNLLVNNAGITYRAVVEHMTEADQIRQLATNYLGPVELIRLALPDMRERGRGKIINVSSVSGMLAMPTMSAYSASKYALEGMSEALWYEVKPYGIDVSLIQPGFIHSDSFTHVQYTEDSRPENCGDGPYSDVYAHMTPFIARLMGRSWVSPAAVARLILKVIRTENPPLWVPATPDAVLFYYLRRLVPRRLLLPLLFAFLPGARDWGKRHTHRRQKPT